MGPPTGAGLWVRGVEEIKACVPSHILLFPSPLKSSKVTCRGWRGELAVTESLFGSFPLDQPAKDQDQGVWSSNRLPLGQLLPSLSAFLSYTFDFHVFYIFIRSTQMNTEEHGPAAALRKLSLSTQTHSISAQA